jgi:hypothetical protein
MRPAIVEMLPVTQRAALLVRLGGYRRMGENLLQLGSTEKGLAVPVIVKWPDPYRIAGAEQVPAGPVPYRKSEIAKHPNRRFFAPKLVSPQNHLCVSIAFKLEPAFLEGSGKFRAVIDPSIARQRPASASTSGCFSCKD